MRKERTLTSWSNECVAGKWYRREIWMIPCTGCAGVGYAYLDDSKCPICDGTGELRTSIYVRIKNAN